MHCVFTLNVDSMIFDCNNCKHFLRVVNVAKIACHK